MSLLLSILLILAILLSFSTFLCAVANRAYGDLGFFTGI